MGKDNKKLCPDCGNQCNPEDLYCSICNYKFVNSDNCEQISKSNNEDYEKFDQKFDKLDENKTKGDYFYLAIISIIVILGAFYFYNNFYTKFTGTDTPKKQTREEQIPYNQFQQENHRTDFSEEETTTKRQNLNDTNKKNDIETVNKVDFDSYMQNIQREIKSNWNPPKGQESKRVVVLFSVAKDGSLLGTKIIKSSDDEETDNAAIDAINDTAPFSPLPREYTKSSVDIQFTFDYNVYKR